MGYDLDQIDKDFTDFTRQKLRGEINEMIETGVVEPVSGGVDCL